MTSKIIVNNIEADAGISTVTFNSKVASSEFVGNVTGNVTGNATGLSGSPTLTGITSISTTNLTVNGNRYPSAGPLSNRNLVMNGSMEVIQRGSAAVTTDGSYPCDRWIQNVTTSGAVSVQRVTDVTPNGFTAGIACTVTTADATTDASDSWRFQQHIEGNNVDHLQFGTANALPVTVSFWARSSETGTFCMVLLGSSDGSTPDRSYVSEYTIQSSNTWEYKTITVPGDTGGTWHTGTGKGLTVRFGLTAGSDVQQAAGSWGNTNAVGSSNQTQLLETVNATFYISGVQVEAGNVATPFEYRPRAYEIQLCQRYYCQSYNISVAPGSTVYQGAIHCRNDQATAMTTHFTNTRFPVVMRANPTVTLYSPENGVADRVSDWNQGGSHVNNGTVSSVTHVGSQGFGRISLSAAEGPTIIFHYTANAEL